MRANYAPKLIAALAVLAAACGPVKKSSNARSSGADATAEVPPNVNEAPPTAAGPAPDIDALTVKTLEVKGSAMNLLQGQAVAGPQSLLLNSEALKPIYQRVFDPKAPRGVKTTGFFATNPTEMFTPQQKVLLGDFNVTSIDVTQRRADLAKEDTQVYHKVLREFLGDACTNLVTVELAAAPAGNKLVRRKAAPTAADIDAFMTRLFGYAAGAGVMHEGAQVYQAVFQASLAEKGAVAPEQADADYLADLYKLMCIAIGSDPRVYLR